MLRYAQDPPEHEQPFGWGLFWMAIIDDSLYCNNKGGEGYSLGIKVQVQTFNPKTKIFYIKRARTLDIMTTASYQVGFC